jgi:hypothetical protein
MKHDPTTGRWEWKMVSIPIHGFSIEATIPVDADEFDVTVRETDEGSFEQLRRVWVPNE